MPGVRLVAAVVCVGTLLAPGALHAQALKLAIDRVQAATGQTVTIPIQVSGAAGVGEVQMEVGFDPALLDGPSVELAGLMAGHKPPVFTVPQPGRLQITLTATSAISGDGAIASIKATVKGEAGQMTLLTIENAKAFAFEGRSDIPVGLGNGMLTIAAGAATEAAATSIQAQAPETGAASAAGAATDAARTSTGAPSTSPTSAIAPSGGGGVVLPGGKAGTSSAGAVVLLLGCGALILGILVVLRARGTTASGSTSTVVTGLEIREPGGSARRVRITAARITIGRGADAGVPVNDPNVSMIHAEIVAGPGGLVLRDLGSANGTRLNGQKISESAVYLGDDIVVGSTRIVLSE